MKTALPISVIICAYTEQRWADLLAAVRSVQKQRTPPTEIIVVIDHNRPLWQRAVSALPGVQVIENHQQQGLSGARNSGIAVAHGDIVAFMDEDAVAESTWLSYLAAAYQRPQVMGVGGAITATWETGRPSWFPSEFDWVVGCTYQGMPTSPMPVRNLIGCNMSFRRELFAAIGGFRQDIGRIGTRPVGCEETELCIRAQQRWPTRTLLYQPLARVYHHVPTQRATWRYFYARCYAEGLSKAQVTQSVGAHDGLAAERRYTFHTLPQGAWHGLRDGCWRGELGGFGRTAAITTGLAITTAGYVAGQAKRLLTKVQTTPKPLALTTAEEPRP